MMAPDCELDPSAASADPSAFSEGQDRPEASPDTSDATPTVLGKLQKWGGSRLVHQAGRQERWREETGRQAGLQER